MNLKNVYTVTVNGISYTVEVECTDTVLPQRYLPAQILELGRPAPWVMLRRKN